MNGSKQIRRVLGTAAHLGGSTVRSLAPAWQNRQAFGDLSAYCTFVGYPRSGHTLVGSLLDAHPDVVIAHELDALRLVRWRVPRSVLFGLLLRRSEDFAASGSRWMGYSYAVPGGWQGRYRVLRVIGDKRGATSSTRLGARPHLVQRLRATVALPLRFVRVTRNPFDNVARMYLVARERGVTTLADTIPRYRRLAEDSDCAKALVPEEEWLDVRSEELVADPKGILRRLCRFLGIVPTTQYLDSAAAIVFTSPNRTRDKVDWSRPEIEQMEELVARTPHLTGYSLD
jgi:hypothetical protein